MISTRWTLQWIAWCEWIGHQVKWIEDAWLGCSYDECSNGIINNCMSSWKHSSFLSAAHHITYYLSFLFASLLFGGGLLDCGSSPLYYQSTTTSRISHLFISSRQWTWKFAELCNTYNFIFSSSSFLQFIFMSISGVDYPRVVINIYKVIN